MANEAFSLKSIVYAVWEILAAFNITDDNDITEDYLENLAVVINQSLIKELVNEKKNISDYYVPVDREIQSVSAATAVVSGITFSANRMLQVATIPNLIKGVGWRDIGYVGSSDFTKRISRKSLQAFNAIEENQETSHLNVYTRIGDSLYFKLNTSMSKIVRIVCLLSDPRDSDGYSEDDIFMCPSYYKLQLLMVKHVSQSFNIPADKIDDAQSVLRMNYEKTDKRSSE